MSKSIRLYLIENDEQRDIARVIVEQNHSYVPSFDSVGRRIDWFICVDDRIVGVIGVGSATYPPCKDVLSRLGVTKKEYKSIFNNIANNWRFCMKERIPNIGTRILKEMRGMAQYEWKKKYGDDLRYIITFVGGGHDGAVYKADNWEIIGTTSGLPSHKSVSMKWDNNEGIKDKFVKPTGEDKKIIFFKELPKKMKSPQQDNLLFEL